MEIASRVPTSGAAQPARWEGTKNRIAATNLDSIAASVEAALAQVTFSSREIEGVLALDDPSWRSIAVVCDE
jgi:hypothetical protein